MRGAEPLRADRARAVLWGLWSSCPSAPPLPLLPHLSLLPQPGTSLGLWPHGREHLDSISGLPGTADSHHLSQPALLLFIYNLKTFFLFLLLSPYSYTLPSLTHFCAFSFPILMQLGRRDTFLPLGHRFLFVICEWCLISFLMTLSPALCFCQGHTKHMSRRFCSQGLVCRLRDWRGLLICVETSPVPQWCVCVPFTSVRLLPPSRVCCPACWEGIFPLLPLGIANFREILFSISVGENSWARDASRADPCNDSGSQGQQGDQFCSPVKGNMLQALLEQSLREDV